MSAYHFLAIQLIITLKMYFFNNKIYFNGSTAFWPP